MSEEFIPRVSVLRVESNDAELRMRLAIEIVFSDGGRYLIQGLGTDHGSAARDLKVQLRSFEK